MDEKCLNCDYVNDRACETCLEMQRQWIRDQSASLIEMLEGYRNKIYDQLERSKREDANFIVKLFTSDW